MTEFIEGLVETYPGLQYLDGFPQVITQTLTDTCITCAIFVRVDEGSFFA